MRYRKEILSVVRSINRILTVVEELLEIDIDYDTLCKNLRMFKDFVKEQSDAEGKT